MKKQPKSRGENFSLSCRAADIYVLFLALYECPMKNNPKVGVYRENFPLSWAVDISWEAEKQISMCCF